MLSHFVLLIGKGAQSGEKGKKEPLKNLLSSKSILFFPGIVLSAGWTILNILKMINYIDSLKNENPECTKANPNKLAIFIPTILACLIVKHPLETTAYEIFMRIIPQGKFPVGSELR